LLRSLGPLGLDDDAGRSVDLLTQNFYSSAYLFKRKHMGYRMGQIQLTAGGEMYQGFDIVWLSAIKSE
jgi:hypothetical protein